MAVTSAANRLKFRLKYEKGSQTFSGCNPTTDDETLFEVGQTISNLRKDENVEMTKIMESDLTQE